MAHSLTKGKTARFVDDVVTIDGIIFLLGNEIMKLHNELPYPQNVFETIRYYKTPNLGQIIRLSHILSERTEKQKETFFRFFNDGLTESQIARLEGIHPSTVHKRLSATCLWFCRERSYILYDNKETYKDCLYEWGLRYPNYLFHGKMFR